MSILEMDKLQKIEIPVLICVVKLGAGIWVIQMDKISCIQ